jgi:hypothetical protein
MKKIVRLRPPHVHFTLDHPITGKKRRFESWIVLCNFIVDKASQYAEEEMEPMLRARIDTIADEIMATVEEHDAEGIDESEEDY